MADTQTGFTGKLAQNATQTSDNIAAPIRTDRRGEQYVENLWNGIQLPAIEGTYIALDGSGVLGTGVNTSIATGTTFAATQAICVIYNGDPVKDLILDYFKVIQLTVDTAGVIGRVVHVLDQGNRYASGGSAMLPYPTSGSGVSPANLIAYCGAVTATAATSAARRLGSNVYSAGVGVLGQEITFRFGGGDPHGSFAVPTTNVASFAVSAPPIVINPGWSYVMLEAKTSRSATGTGEYYGGLVAR